MKKINVKLFWFIPFIVFTLVILNLGSSSTICTFNEQELNDGKLKSSNGSSIIIINNNSDLKQIASSGNGSQINPYKIEDKNIDGNGSLYCILVNNTNKYFILKGCTLHNSSYGIYLNNVTNAIISVNIVRHNVKSGILIKNSINNTIQNNFLSENKFYGILSDNSNRTILRANTILNNNITGIYLNNSNYNNLTFNSLVNHYQAILLHSSNYSSVINNTGNDNIFGVIELNCIENFFSGNDLRDFTPKTREEDNGGDSVVNRVVDFTIVLIVSICMSSICFFVFRIHFKILNKRK